MDKTARIHAAARAAGLGEAVSRRGFITLAAGGLAGLSLLSLGEVFAAPPPLVVLESAKGMLVADPSRCTGCLRCELACVEFNDGVSQPSRARIKVSGSLNFGPAGPTGGPDMQGAFGNGLVAPGVCRQCAHPAPCASACPAFAITADKTTGARVVDQEACLGCGQCRQACPYDMIVFDETRGKADKCFLCGGQPKCVAACPAGAIVYAPWRDAGGAS